MLLLYSSLLVGLTISLIDRLSSETGPSATTSTCVRSSRNRLLRLLGFIPLHATITSQCLLLIHLVTYNTRPGALLGVAPLHPRISSNVTPSHHHHAAGPLAPPLCGLDCSNDAAITNLARLPDTSSITTRLQYKKRAESQTPALRILLVLFPRLKHRSLARPPRGVDRGAATKQARLVFA